METAYFFRDIRECPIQINLQRAYCREWRFWAFRYYKIRFALSKTTTPITSSLLLITSTPPAASSQVAFLATLEIVCSLTQRTISVAATFRPPFICHWQRSGSMPKAGTCFGSILLFRILIINMKQKRVSDDTLFCLVEVTGHIRLWRLYCLPTQMLCISVPVCATHS